MRAILLEWTNLEYLSQRYGTQPLQNVFLLLAVGLFEPSLVFW